MRGMPEDVLEWGDGSAAEKGRWGAGLKVPPVTPYVLAGVGAVAYFVSLSRPWRIYKLSEDSGGTISVNGAFTDRPEFAMSLGLGLAYMVALLVLAAIFPLVLMGSRRARRVGTGVAVAVGVMCLAQLISIVTLGGQESIFFNDAPGLHTVVTNEIGLYAAFVAVAGLLAATIATHYVGTRRQRPAEEEPEYAADTARDLTVSAS
jgi:hypothetical protein